MSHTAIEAGVSLHHLAFETANPGRLAAFYDTVMGMRASQISESEWRYEEPSRRMVLLQGSDQKLSFAGFACRDSNGLATLRARAERFGVHILDCPSPYFKAGSFAVRDPSTNIIVFGVPRAATAPLKLTKLNAPMQHLTVSAEDVAGIVEFYQHKLCFILVDRVLHADREIATAFLTSNHEHHTLACFKSERVGMDHHSYEVGDWAYIRDWCDHFADHDVQVAWGPGRNGPRNILFVFIVDPDGNWIEVSAEYEVIYDRSVVDWPRHPRTLNKWGHAILRS